MTGAAGLTHRHWLAGLSAGLLGARADAADRPLRHGPRPLKWRELLPRGWVPAIYFSGMPDLADADWSEDDPRSRALLAKMIERGRDAPPRRQLDGAEVRIAGFVMPLVDGEGGGERDLTRFLLTPYQGACVHRPPPPANQAIWVDAEPPLPAALAPYPVWVHGRLRIELQRTRFMYTTWRLQATACTAFDADADRPWLPVYNVF